MKKIIYIAIWIGSLTYWAQAQTNTSFDIPFEVVNGMIMVEASVNGDTGTFVLDTGSPTIVVNSRNVNDLRLAEANPQTHMDKRLAVKVNHFRWADIERQDLQAVAMDISHLESASSKKILGVIGFDVLRQYELLFDFEHQHLMMLPAKDNWVHRVNEPLHSLRFKMHGQLPVVKAEVAGVKLKLGMDTGGTNLLAEGLLDELEAAQIGQVGKEKMVGFGHRTHYLPAAKLAGVELDGTPFDETRFVFDDLDYLEEQRIDGLLGLPFLAQFRFSINYRENRIYFWRYDAALWGRRI